MKQKQKDSDVLSSGLGSVTDMLKSIANDTAVGKNLVQSFKQTKDFITKEIFEPLSKNFNVLVNQPTNINTNKIFVEMRDILLDIRNSMIPQKGDKGESKNEKTPTITPDKLSIKDIPGIITETFLGLEKIKRILTNKFLKQLEKFSLSFEKLFNLDKDKVDTFSDRMDKLINVLTLLDKKLTPVSTSITKFAIGFGLLTLAAANPLTFIAMGTLTLFVGMLTKITSGKTLTDITGFAFGMLILAGALIMMNYVDISSMFKLVGFIFILGIALKTVNGKGSTFSVQSGGIVGFAFGIGLLALGLLAFEEIGWTGMFKLITFIVMLGVALKLVGGGGGFSVNSKGLSGFAFGLGLMVLAILAFEVIEWTSMFKIIMFVALLGIALKLMPKGGIASGLPGFAFGLGLMVLAMLAFEYVPEAIMWRVLGFVAILGLALRLYNKESAVSFAILSAGILAISGALYVFKKTDVTLPDMLMFVGIILAIGLVAVGLGAIAALAGIGMGVMIGLGAAMALFAVSMFIISKTDFDLSKMLTFMASVSMLTLGFAALMIPAIPAVITAVMLLPVGVLSIMLALSLKLISALNIKSEKIDQFKIAVGKLVDSYSDVGIIASGKALIVSALLFPLVLVSIGFATLFKKIEELNVSEDKMKTFSKIFSSFITTTVTEVNKAVPALKTIQPGLDSLSKLVNVSSGLVDVVRAFANMTYNEYAVKDGKLVLVGQKKITDAEIAQVGINVGKLIEGLIKPLSVISSDDDFWDFGGGLKVKNPFAGGWFGDDNSGVGRLKLIGEAFLPLTEAIQKMTAIKTMADPKIMETYQKDLVNFVNTLDTIFKKLETFENDNAIDSIHNIGEFGDALKKFDVKNTSSLSDSISKMMNNFADEAKWKIINANLISLKNNFKDIVTNINKLNLEKAKALETSLKLLSDKNTQKGLQEVVEHLAELVGALHENTETNTSFFGKLFSPDTETDKKETETKTIKEKVEEKKDEAKEVLQTLFDELSKQLTAINEKLNGKLKVAIVDGSSNRIS